MYIFSIIPWSTCMYTNYIMYIKALYMCGPFIIVIRATLAETSMDYDVVETILIFRSCETRACTNVTIVDDKIAEPTEWFSVKLGRTDNLNPRLILNPFVAVIEITANNGM